MNSSGPMALAHQGRVCFSDLSTTFVSIRKKKILQDAPEPKLHTRKVSFKHTDFKTSDLQSGSPTSCEIEATSSIVPENFHFKGRET